MKWIMSFLTFVSMTVNAKPIESISLNMNNTLFFTGTIAGIQTDTFTAALFFKRSYLPRLETLYVLIDSEGGNVELGYAIAKILTMAPNVTLVCLDCASMAAGIFELTDKPRLVLKNSSILMHHIRRMIDGNFQCKELADLKNKSDFFDAIFIARPGITKQQYVSKIDNFNDYVLEGEDIVKNKLADKLVTFSCDPYIKEIAPKACK